MALTWPYSDTAEEIYSRIAARMGNTVSVREGTFGDIFARSVSYELWRFYDQMQKTLPIAFVDETSGAYLEARCAEFGITRKTAGTAAAELTFTGAAGVEIPAGTAATTASGLAFETVADAEIDGANTAVVTAQAADFGAAYNVGAGRINRLLTAVSGVTAVANAAPAAGGYDAETDAALFARLEAFRQRPATSGNAYHYERWALEVEGVGAAHVLELWDGPGTVKVVLAGNHMEPVDEDICAACATHIETLRPVGAAVTVESAQAVTVDVSVTVQLAVSATKESVTAALTAALRGYLHGIAFRTGAVVYNRVAYFLLGIEGVVDFAELTLNGGTENIPLGDTQVPVLGTVEVSVYA